MENVESNTAVLRLSRTGRLRFITKPPGFPKLSKAKLERMRRNIADSVDPTRYVIVAPFAKGDVLYYRVEDAGFGSHISMATLFKRKQVALAASKAIYGSKVRRSLKVVQVKKTKSGVRVVGDLSTRNQ